MDPSDVVDAGLFYLALASAVPALSAVGGAVGQGIGEGRYLAGCVGGFTGSLVGALVGVTPALIYFVIHPLTDNVGPFDSLAIVGLPVGGSIGAIGAGWLYVTSDATGTVFGTGYFTGAMRNSRGSNPLGLSTGDVILTHHGSSPSTIGIVTGSTINQVSIRAHIEPFRSRRNRAT